MGKMDDLYQEHLKEKLDMVFAENSGQKYSNTIAGTILRNKVKDYDRVYEFINGFAIVKDDNKYNFIDEEYNLVSKNWFDLVFDFRGDFALVKNGNKYNYIDRNGTPTNETWLDKIFVAEGKYTKVMQGNTFNFIDENKKLVSNIWYDEIKSYKDGYAVVRKDNLYSFIDQKGNRINNEWYENVDSFQNGYAGVKKDDKWNYIDLKGNEVCTIWFSINGPTQELKDNRVVFRNKNKNLINNESYDSAHEFVNGFACVKVGNYWSYIDVNGNRINNDLYDEAFDFTFYAKVMKDGKYNYIDMSGKEVCPIWYDDISEFKYGHAMARLGADYFMIDMSGNKITEEQEQTTDTYDYNKKQVLENGNIVIEKNGKYNILLADGGLVSDKIWYDEIGKFVDGIAKVKRNSKYNIMDMDGKNLSSSWYDEIGDFENGFAIVKDSNSFNFIDSNGRRISNIWYEEVENFNEGFAKVKYSGKYNFINSSGTNLTKMNFDKVGEFSDGFAICEKDKKEYILSSNGRLIVRDGDKYNLVDDKGVLIWNWVNTKEQLVNLNLDILNRSEIVNGYNTKKKLFGGYKCSNGAEQITLKFKPLKFYEPNYVLCIDEDELCLYNKVTKKYEEMGSIYESKFDDNFIYDGKSVYLMYGGKKLDITKYYMDNLLNRKELRVTPNVKDILSRVEFDYIMKDVKDELTREDRETLKALQEQQKKEEQLEQLKQMQQEKEAAEEQRKVNIANVLRQIKENFAEYDRLIKEGKEIERIKVENIFVDVDDHKEVIEEFRPFLAFIDLSPFSFKNVNVSGLNFKGSNVNITPRETYKMDLSSCDFTGIHFDPMTAFGNVDIRGAKFSDDEDSKTFDMLPVTMKDAIYDINTTYNAESLIEILDKNKELSDSKQRM